MTYEGYGPHGIAIFVETATDNTTRTVANVRSYFNKHGGSLVRAVVSNSCSIISVYSILLKKKTSRWKIWNWN